MIAYAKFVQSRRKLNKRENFNFDSYFQLIYYFLDIFR